MWWAEPATSSSRGLISALNDIAHREETMANELANTVKEMARTIKDYVEAVANLKVETEYVELDGGAGVKIAARTEISLDGDCKVVLPMRRTESNILEVDSSLYDLHKQNVETAISYRKEMVSSLLEVIREAVAK
jgi:hypothetical protein